MFPNIIVQALKLVTIVENWIPLPVGDRLSCDAGLTPSEMP